MRNIERFVLRPLAVVSVAYAVNFGIDNGVKTVDAAGPCGTPVAGNSPCESDKQLADAKATQTAIAVTQTAVATDKAKKDKEVADLEARRLTPTPASSVRVDKDGLSISIDIDNNITIPPQYLYGPDTVVMTRKELDKFIEEGARSLLEARSRAAQATPSPKPYVAPSPSPEVITKIETKTVTIGEEHLPWEPGFPWRSAAFGGVMVLALEAIYAYRTRIPVVNRITLPGPHF